MTDAAPADPAPTTSRRPNPIVQIASAFLLPLFFVIAFPLAFVSALHNPTPHELPILIVGPDQVVSQIATTLDETGRFAAERTDVVSEARSRVEDRSFDGSIQIDVVPAADEQSAPTFAVTSYVAGAEGRAVSAAVESVGDSVAEQLGTTVTVTDVAPLSAEDPLGVGLFYLLTYTSLAAYLVIIVLTQVMPGAKLRVRYAAVAVASIVAPLIAFGLSSIFIGDYGAGFGTIAGLLGVNALYVFTVGCAAIVIEQLLGRAATFGVMALVVFLNFPGAGGASPEAMLPPFWQAIHNVYFGAGAMESFRSIVYFDGNGVGRWLFQLAAWTVGLMLVTFIIHQAKTVRVQRKQLAEVTASAARVASAADPDDSRPSGAEAQERRRHVQLESYQLDDPHYPSLESDGSEQRALPAREGALR
ncbi:hypothetical protein HQQ81_12195 [Microbacteriaceae bacterium VKM Ac-2854]|nr:hypothetical protein [Microbacteriaceae bacterium VKM Ac-2854]